MLSGMSAKTQSAILLHRLHRILADVCREWNEPRALEISTKSSRRRRRCRERHQKPICRRERERARAKKLTESAISAAARSTTDGQSEFPGVVVYFCVSAKLTNLKAIDNTPKGPLLSHAWSLRAMGGEYIFASLRSRALL